MSNIFNAYSIGDRKYVDINVFKKIKIYHINKINYALVGKSNDGKIVSAFVNESQWNEYNVQVEQKTAKKRTKKYQERMKYLKGKKKTKQKNKNKRKVYNEQIQKWLIQHYNLNFNDLNGEDDL